MKSIIYISLFAFLALTGNGCSMSYSFTGADIPAAARTFSIKTFQSNTPLASPNYYLTITESLKDLLLAQTRLDLIEKKGDLQFEGAVTGYVTGNAAVTSGEFTSLNRLTITLKVKYVNTFEREKNFERSFSRFADYSADQNFTDAEPALIEEINAQLIQDIFDASLGAW